MKFEQRLAYQHPGLGDDRELVDHYADAKIAVAKWVGNLLERTYPGHAWHVEVLITANNGQRATGGIIKIRLNGIMPPNYWYNIKLGDTLTDPGGKRTVLKGAGELLERYRLHRGAFDLDQWRQAMNSMPIAERMKGKGYRAPLLQ